MVSKSVPNMRKINVLVEQPQPRRASFCSDSPGSGTNTDENNTQTTSERSSTSTSSDRFDECEVASPSSSSNNNNCNGVCDRNTIAPTIVLLAPSANNGFITSVSDRLGFLPMSPPPPNHYIPTAQCFPDRNSATTATATTAAQRPVWVPFQRKYAPSLEGLHEEISDLYHWLKPTAEEIACRRRIFNRISSILRIKLWPKAQICMYGSVATNSFLPSSDIDICVQTPHGEIEIPEDLQRVADELKETNAFENIIVLDKTAIPVVKCTDRQTQLSVDISFNLYHVGATVHWIQEKLKDLPLLEPLLLLLKQFLSQQGLNNPFVNGGLPSYALVVMLVYFLENIRFDSKNLMNMKNADYAIILGRRPLGVLFHYFLYYYGYAFNFASYGIRVAPRMELMSKEVLARQFGEDPCTSGFWIADPVKEGNNLGKGAHNLMGIRIALAQAYDNIIHTLSYCNSISDEHKSCYWGPMLSLIVHFDEQTVARRAQNIACWREPLLQSPRPLLYSQKVMQRRHSYSYNGNTRPPHNRQNYWRAQQRHEPKIAAREEEEQEESNSCSSNSS